MSGRIIRDEAHARECLEAAAQSGLRARDWARAIGLDARSLNCWRIAFARREESTPVRMVELISAPEVELDNKADFVVRAGAFSVDVPADFDEVALRRLLQVVARC